MGIAGVLTALIAIALLTTHSRPKSDAAAVRQPPPSAAARPVQGALKPWSSPTPTPKPRPKPKPKPVDPAKRNPVGTARFDRLTSALRISGTSSDPDAHRGLPVRVYDNGHLVATTTADARTHRYLMTAALREGTHRIAVVSRNIGTGTADRVDGRITVQVAPAWINSYHGNQGIAAGMLGRYGWGAGEMRSLVKLWNRESNWRTSAYNPSGAYGIPQALPAERMESVGHDWRTSATTQITWGLRYIADRYGSPSAAWGHEISEGWY